MMRLALLLASVGGLGGAIALAALAPSFAAVVLGASMLVQLVLPDILDRWARRPARAKASAGRWLSTRPEPLMLGFVAGGPGRATDVAIADLEAQGRVTRDPDGLRARPALAAGSAVAAPPTDQLPDQRMLADVILATLRTDEPTPLVEVRRVAATSPVMLRLWRAASDARMVRSRWARGTGHTWLNVATFLNAVALPAPAVFAAARLDPPPSMPAAVGCVVVLAVVAGPFAFLAVAEGRRKRLTGFGRDPRTAAGHRAIEVAREEPWATTGPWLIALTGITGSDGLAWPDAPDALDATAAPPTPAPPSGWHIARNREDRAGDDGSAWVSTDWDGDRGEGGGGGDGSDGGG